VQRALQPTPILLQAKRSSNAKQDLMIQQLPVDQQVDVNE
jgi:hypothetical protein